MYLIVSAITKIFKPCYNIHMDSFDKSNLRSVLWYKKLICDNHTMK